MLDVEAKVSKGTGEVTNTMTGFVLGRTTISKLMHLNNINNQSLRPSRFGLALASCEHCPDPRLDHLR